MKLRAAAVTDVGRVRPHNEDEVLADDPLYAVADGMGGHAGGEVASHIAIETLKEAFRDDPTAEGLVRAMKQANVAVWQRANDNTELYGMGTTTTAAALVESGGEQVVEIAHVGDSRAYLLRDGELQRLTEDHSLVEDLVRSGRLSPEEAENHPQKHIVTRVLGHGEGDGGEIEVDTVVVAPYRGDRFLLASDGLTNEVSDDQIASVLRRFADPEDAARELIRVANANGGNDTRSVVVVDVVDDDDKAGAASQALADEPAPTTTASTASVRVPPAESRTDAHRSERRPPRQRGEAPKMTMRTVLFVVAFLAVIGLAVLAITWYARGSYYVGVKSERVAIFRGRPGGFLWVKPTVVSRYSDLALKDVPPARQDELHEGQPEPTLRAARHYVANLRDESKELSATTSTTAPATPTSTTAAP